MRRSCIFVLLAATAAPLGASKHLTVAQLQQALNKAISTRKPDAQIAQQVSGLELTEQLTEATLGQLEKRLVPGSQTARALELLADRSTFLEPPASELPQAPIPENAEQIRILAAARRYSSETLPRLPDFFATRVIDLYDDRPQEFRSGDWPTRSGLHLIGTSSGEISVRAERENQPATQGSSVWRANMGLISGGEFGNTLGMILADTVKGRISWSHWEDTAQGRVAVFHYEVPASVSHYEVLSALRREAPRQDSDSPKGGSRGTSQIVIRSDAGGSNSTVVNTRPGYHGSIQVNPVDGTIRRVTMDADLTRGTPFRRAAILVEYGPVHVAGTMFICPVRSLALSRSLDDPETTNGDAPSEWLNETHFTNYHRFGSTARMLAGNSASPIAKAEPATTDAMTKSDPRLATSSGPQTHAAEGSPVGPPTPAAEPASSGIQAPRADTPQSGTGRTVEPPPPASDSPAGLMTKPAAATDGTNESPALAAAPPGNVPGSGGTLHVNVPELLIPTVVRDKQGRAVGTLSQRDFTVFDQGKRRTITGFNVVKSAAGGAETGVSNGSAVPTPGISPIPGSPQNRFIVFLFDDRHLDSSDLAITQKAAMKLLDEPIAATDYEAVVSLMGVNSGITRDRAVLQAAIKKLRVYRSFQHDIRECPDIDYYSADKILNHHDDMEFQVAVAKVRNCNGRIAPGPESEDGIDNPTGVAQRFALSAAAHALAIGEEDARQSLVSIGSVVTAMSKLPGQRTLILVSPGFLTLSPETMNFKSQALDRAAVSDVVINALDARGLYAGNADASQGANTSISQTIGQTSQDHLAAMEASENVMAELANGTGGTLFQNNNDLEGGLRSLAAAPQYLYLLTISLKDVTPTGTYHRLQVNVDEHGMDVQARRGYFVPKATDPR